MEWPDILKMIKGKKKNTTIKIIQQGSYSHLKEKSKPLQISKT